MLGHGVAVHIRHRVGFSFTQTPARGCQLTTQSDTKRTWSPNGGFISQCLCTAAAVHTAVGWADAFPRLRLGPQSARPALFSRSAWLSMSQA